MCESLTRKSVWKEDISNWDSLICGNIIETEMGADICFDPLYSHWFKNL